MKNILSRQAHPMLLQKLQLPINLALSYFKSFNLPLKIVRPFNVYGPRQSQRAIIPTIIMQILNNNKNISVGNIYPSRDYTFC